MSQCPGGDLAAVAIEKAAAVGEPGRASASLDDLPSSFVNFTPSEGFGFFSSSIGLDTKTFGGAGATGDGDWDLLIQAENEDQVSNFEPQ